MMQVNSNSLSPAIPLSQSYSNSQTEIEPTLPEQSTHLGHTWSPKQSDVNNEDLKTNQVAEEILETHSLNNNNQPVSLKKEPKLLQNSVSHLIHSSSSDSPSSERISSQDVSDRIEINSPRIPESITVDVVPLNSENPTSQFPSTSANHETSIQQLVRQLRNESEPPIHSQPQRAQPSILATNGRTYTCTFNCFSNNALNPSRGFGHYLIPATVVAGMAGITGAVLIANATNDDEKLAGQILTPVGFVGFAIGTVSAILRAAMND